MELEAHGNIPVGYVFSPTDEELLSFLMDKIVEPSYPLPPEIKTLDLYADDTNPWTINNNNEQHCSCSCYVLCKLKKMGPGQSRIRRTAGVGTWKEQQSRTVLFQYRPGLKLKGLRRYYVFQPKKGADFSRELHGHWIMNEYSLLNLQADLGGIDDHDYVICEIHNKDSKRKSVHNSNDDRAMKKIRSESSNNEEEDDDRDKERGGGQDEQAMVPYYQDSCNDHKKDDEDKELAEFVERSMEIGEEEVDPSVPVVDDDDKELVDLIESRMETDQEEQADHHQVPSVAVDQEAVAEVSKEASSPSDDINWDELKLADLQIQRPASSSPSCLWDPVVSMDPTLCTNDFTFLGDDCSSSFSPPFVI